MYTWVLVYLKYMCMCSISRISPSWARAECKKTLCLLHYPRKIKFISSFLHSFILSVCLSLSVCLCLSVSVCLSVSLTHWVAKSEPQTIPESSLRVQARELRISPYHQRVQNSHICTHGNLWSNPNSQPLSCVFCETEEPDIITDTC